MGTVRTNLVPFGEVPDVELWEALRQAGLADTVRGFDVRPPLAFVLRAASCGRVASVLRAALA